MSVQIARRLVLTALVLSLLFAPPAHAAVTVIVRPGGWSDVVKAPDGFRLVRATATEVVTERPDGSLTWRTALPEPILYLRAAVDETGTIQAIAQGNESGLAYVISAGGVRSIGGSFGQNATAIAWFPARGFVYYVQTSPTTFTTFDLANCMLPCVSFMPATSQGFRDIQPDGMVRRGDDFMTANILGRQFWSMAQRGPITVGQCDPPGICVAAEGRVFTVFQGNAFEPHLALDGATLAIATRSEFGAALVIVSPPYPPADVTVIDPPIDPPPPPPPPPIGPSQKPTVERIRLKYPTPLGARHWEFLVEVAQATGAKLFQKDAGVLVPALNVRVSQDVIIVAPEWIDILVDGEGAARPDWQAHANAGESDKWIDVSRVTLPGGPVDPPPPPPPPPVDPTLAARVAALERMVAELTLEMETAFAADEARMDVLTARLDATKPFDLIALQAAIDGALANYWIDGKTEADRLGLQHRVRLGLTKRQQ